MNTATLQAKMSGMIESRSTPDLIEMLASVTGAKLGTPEQIVRLAIVTELEARYDVDAEMEAWVMDDESALTYDEMLASVIVARMEVAR